MSALASTAVALSSRAFAPTAIEITLACADGMTLAAQSWKPSSEHTTKRRILCLHGWMDNSASFHYLAPRIMEHFPMDTELVALDFPGHGLSSHKSIDGPPLMLSESAFYVAEAVRRLKWDSESTPFTLIGHSMGAAVGCLYSAVYPEQVKNLVLLEGAGPLARKTEDIAKHIRMHVQRRQTALIQNKSPRIYPSLELAVATRRQTAKNFPGDQSLSKDAATLMVKRGSVSVGEGVRFCHDARLQWPSLQYFTTEQTEALYKDIQCPTALILAKSGWPFDEDRQNRTLELLRPVHYTTLAGSHHFHADPDTAESVAQEVLRFLEQE
jgi:pimeloyl-ACP methyl ester carboxylesterase